MLAWESTTNCWIIKQVLKRSLEANLLFSICVSYFVKDNLKSCNCINLPFIYRLQFLGSKITADGDCSHEIKRHLLLGRKAMMNLDNILKSRDITLLSKVHIIKAMVFSNSHVWRWELDHKEGWAPKNWCFQSVVLEEPFESPLDCKVIKSVNPKGNQPWIFIGRIDGEAETPILWPPDANS